MPKQRRRVQVQRAQVRPAIAVVHRIEPGVGSPALRRATAQVLRERGRRIERGQRRVAQPVVDEVEQEAGILAEGRCRARRRIDQREFPVGKTQPFDAHQLVIGRGSGQRIDLELAGAPTDPVAGHRQRIAHRILPRKPVDAMRSDARCEQVVTAAADQRRRRCGRRPHRHAPRRAPVRVITVKSGAHLEQQVAGDRWRQRKRRTLGVDRLAGGGQRLRAGDADIVDIPPDPRDGLRVVGAGARVQRISETQPEGLVGQRGQRDDTGREPGFAE